MPVWKALRKGLEQRKAIGLGNDKTSPRFVTLRGQIGERCSIRSMQNMIREAGQRARIKEPVTPRILRHKCAFMLREAGIDIETRAKMLGHSIETASKYGARGASELEKAASLLDYAEAA